jgi:DivIVA domain
MLPPHELKNKEFSKAVRGYSMVDVDEHIEFIIEKYTQLYRANDELERKLQQAEADLKEFKSDEESIRSALINAQRASAKIISEANERADVIIRSSKTNCDKIISEFNDKILEERETLLKIRNVVAAFKRALFNQYTSHIEYIENIAPEIDLDIEEQIEKSDYTKLVVERIKKDISAGIVQEYGDTLPKSTQDYDLEQINEPVKEELPEPLDIRTALAAANEIVDDDDVKEAVVPVKETSLVEEVFSEEEPVEEELELDFDDMIAVMPKKESKKAEQEKVLQQEEIESENAERLEREWLENERINNEREKPVKEKKEPKFEVDKKPAVPEESINKSMSMKERIKLLSKKIDETEETDGELQASDDDFDDDYDDFVKTMEINKKKKKPRPADDDK